MKVKLVPRHLNRLDVSPERFYSHRHQLITQTSRLISPVKSDGRAYVLVRTFTLLTRYRMTFSVPFFCFSLHLLHSVASASGRVSEKRKKCYKRNSDQGRVCAKSNFIEACARVMNLITQLRFFKNFILHPFSFYLSPKISTRLPFFFHR